MLSLQAILALDFKPLDKVSTGDYLLVKGVGVFVVRVHSTDKNNIYTRKARHAYTTYSIKTGKGKDAKIASTPEEFAKYKRMAVQMAAVNKIRDEMSYLADDLDVLLENVGTPRLTEFSSEADYNEVMKKITGTDNFIESLRRMINEFQFD